jgi:hypothetical protein
MKLSALYAAAVLTASVLTGFASADITGKVTLDGEAPEPQKIDMGADPKCKHPDALDESIVVGDKNELANVVVSIKAPEGKKWKVEVPKEPVTIDQKGCQYIPHVVGIIVGQELVVKNSDDTAHNVRSQSIDNDPFNIAQPGKGTSNKLGNKIKIAERFGIKCDIHPWMLVQVNAFEHPFFAVSKEDGTFSIPTKGLEDGDYTLEIWHEKLASEPITQEIKVKDGKATVEEVKIPMDAAAAQADDTKATVKLASSLSKDGKTEAACCKGASKAALLVAAAKGK